MGKYLLQLVAVFVVHVSVQGQNFADGFYLTQPIPPKTCKHKIQMGKGKDDVLCLTAKPIIDTTAFVSVSGIEKDSASSVLYVDLGMTPEAMNTLRTLARSMNEATMVLMLGNEPIGVFDYTGILGMTQNFIRVSDAGQYSRIDGIHQTFSRIVRHNQASRKQ